MVHEEFKILRERIVRLINGEQRGAYNENQYE